MERGIGDNGGPPLAPSQKLSAKIKLIRIQQLLERNDLTAAQKCVGIGIVTSADQDGNAHITTPQLQTFSSSKDRDTVFRATKKLTEVNFVKKTSSWGKAGVFQVLPSDVIQAVADAFHERQTGTLKPDGVSGGITGGTSAGKGSGGQKSEGSEPGELGRSKGTSSEPAYNYAGARADSTKLNTNNNNNQLPPHPDSGEDEVELSCLNGSADALAGFIAKYAFVRSHEARRMLRSNIQAFSAPAVLEAFAITEAKMASEVVATPYQYFIKVCSGVKAKHAEQQQQQAPKKSFATRMLQKSKGAQS
jgi:hypothetical protein